MTTHAYDPALRRWLKTLDLAPDAAPSAEQFEKFLGRVDRHLKHLQSDRELLTRTLETSTEEMATLNRQVRADRDRLDHVMTAAAEALSVFSMATDDESLEDVSSAMTVARSRFAARLGEVAGDLHAMEDSSRSIEILRSSFMQLADQITALVRETNAAAGLRKQLEVAGAVQRMLVPARAEQSHGQLELAALFRPAAACGGDWWTVHKLADERLLVLIGDVTGHGVSSAIITGAAKGATDLARTASRGKLGPGALLRMLNTVIASASRRQYMMTAVALVIDPMGHVVMANAGHPSPLRLRGEALTSLPTHREPPLGASPGHAYTESELTLEPGDRVLLYTDGVTECQSPSGEEFAERRLRSVLGRCGSTDAVGMRERVAEALASFADGAEADDDVTAVALRWLG